MKEFSWEGLPFVKMSASGNDFILINNFKALVPPTLAPLLAQKLCPRAISVGADGLILIEPPRGEASFSWRFYNADGSEAEMCGNGGRCAARFAVEEGLASSPLAFETLAGLIKAEVSGRKVKIQLPPPKDLKLNLLLPLNGEHLEAHFINTGVPHVVILVEELEKVPLLELGKKIRFHEFFSPAGTNVNVVQIIGPQRIRIRTYERGVEGETLACGTGACASAIIATLLGKISPPVEVKTKGGEILRIFFDPKDLTEVYLEGEARIIYRARLSEEAIE